MTSFLLILLSAVLVCHYAPALLGTRLFEETDQESNTRGLALASMLLIAVLSPLSHVLGSVALRPAGAQYLHTFALVIVLMTLAPLAGELLRKLGPWTPVRPGFFLAVTCNTAILGTALLAAKSADLTTALWSGLGLGLAFAVLLVAFSALNARIATAPVPLVFRDAPAALVTVGLIALALMGLTGLVRD